MTTKLNMVVMILIANLISSNIALAEITFKEEEIFRISWGDKPNQLKIGLPFYEDINNTPSDSSDDFIELGGGPSYSFVDRTENVYFASYRFNQFKAFRPDGELVFDISKNTPKFNKDIFESAITKFFVDTSFNIYIKAFPEKTYIPVVDTLGNLRDRLIPDDVVPGSKVTDINLNSNDVMTFRFKATGEPQVYTFKDSVFTSGGSSGWLASDHNYYYIKHINGDILEFRKYGNPDNRGIADWREIDNKEYNGNIKFTDFLGIDKNLNLYLFIREMSDLEKIQIYSNDYKLIDEIILPTVKNKYLLKLIPFMRIDGNIYEFRCLDDGLHVIRWSRKE